jgi:hypothetical protein
MTFFKHLSKLGKKEPTTIYLCLSAHIGTCSRWLLLRLFVNSWFFGFSECDNGHSGKFCCVILKCRGSKSRQPVRAWRFRLQNASIPV